MAKCMVFRVEEGTGVVVSSLRERGSLLGWAVPSYWMGAAAPGALIKVAYGTDEPVRHQDILARVNAMLSTSRLPLEIRNLHREFWGVALVKCGLCGRRPKIRRDRGHPIAQFGTVAVCGQCLSLSPGKFQAKMFAAKQKGLIQPWDRQLLNAAEAHPCTRTS